MARSSKTFRPGPDPRRHDLNQRDRRKGYQMLLLKIKLKQIPSRVAASVRSKIRRHYTTPVVADVSKSDMEIPF